VDCPACAAPQSAVARERIAEKHPAGRVASDGSVHWGMASAARRGSLARLPTGKTARVPRERIFIRPLIETRDGPRRCADLITPASVCRRGLLGVVRKNGESEYAIACSPFVTRIGGRVDARCARNLTLILCQVINTSNAILALSNNLPPGCPCALYWVLVGIRFDILVLKSLVFFCNCHDSLFAFVCAEACQANSSRRRSRSWRICSRSLFRSSGADTGSAAHISTICRKVATRRS
jgi:hypothetical protein